MALETAVYLNELVATNPVASDGVAQGDDHLRLLKAVLKASFPNLASFPRYLEQPRTDVADSAVPALWASATDYANLLGTTTITGFASGSEGQQRLVRFNSARTLTHNPVTLSLPDNKDLIVSAGDHALIRCSGALVSVLFGTFCAPAQTVGEISFVVGNVAPSGKLKADGSLVLRASYPQLWAYAQACGALCSDATWVASAYYGQFSTGNGSTTFRLPDLREYALIGWADSKTGGLDQGRTIGAFQEQEILSHAHTGSTGYISNDHSHYYTYKAQNQLAAGGPDRWCGSVATGAYTSGDNSNHYHYLTTNSVGGPRNVPRNVALLACISYR